MHGPWGGRRCRERGLKMRGGAIRIMLGGNDTIGEGKGGVGREMAGWGRRKRMLVEEWREYVLCSIGWVDLALFSNFSHLLGLIDKN